jgi:glycosyltransferase involved in cell wall biosynthesis
VRLSNAIRSVVNQTEADFEAIIVDDGSHDDSSSVVVSTFGDPRLTYVRLPSSRGPGVARNAGITRAAAPYIAFLDDDDEWLPSKLAVQLGVLERSPERVGGVYSAQITVDEVTGQASIRRCKEDKFHSAAGDNSITTSSMIVRRGAFDVVGLFDERLYSGQDFDMWIRLAQVFDLIYVDQPLIRYFIHSGYRITDDDARKAHAQEILFAKHRRIFDENPRGHCLMYIALAKRYLRLGDKERAHRCLRKAMRLAPTEPRIYYVFARAFFSRRSALYDRRGDR